jgi:tRNA G46 methylase TrmB
VLFAGRSADALTIDSAVNTTMIQVKLFKPRPFRIDCVPVPANGIDFDDPQQPLDVEIGCGVGLHPIQYAQAHPGRYVVAIEQTREKFEKFQRRFTHHDLPNLLPVHANAISWVSHGLRDQSVDNFFFLYPNPNPKHKDFNKRWYAMPFMEKVIACLKPNGCLHLATNAEFYAVEAKANFEQVWHLETLRYERMQAGDIVPRTHFEKKYLARRETCFDLVLRKVGV